MASPTSASQSDSDSSPVASPIKPEAARVIVGPERKAFRVNKKLLCNAAPFFRNTLEGCPSGNGVSPFDDASRKPQHTRPSNTVHLPNDSPAMFELFKVWLHDQSAFRRHLDEMVNLIGDAPESLAVRFHWAVVHLHIFASQLNLDQLQDLAIDALQDLYLRCDWDVSPDIIEFLFGDREARHTIRLRRWAVAMAAWAMAGGPSHGRDVSVLNADGARYRVLFEMFPEFNAEYTVHVAKLKGGKLDARIKNPQLRIPANKLRNDERQFGFRQCSFHTHRAAVGEGRCPHTTRSMDLVDNFPMVVPLVIDIRPEQKTKKLHKSASSCNMSSSYSSTPAVSAPTAAVSCNTTPTKPKRRAPSFLDVQAAKPMRQIKHVKSPSCPVAKLPPHFEYPDHVPAPLRNMKPINTMVGAF